MAVGALHLMYGLSGSGKTTLAKSLTGAGGLRFTLDEWMIRLYPELPFDSAEYGRRTDAVRELMWSIAEPTLSMGADVIFDWNSWSKERRHWAVAKARRLPARVILHELSATPREASARVRERMRTGTEYSHPVTADQNEQLSMLMEPPEPAEGVVIVRH